MLRETVSVGTVCGIRVSVSLTWLLVSALLMWSLGAMYLPSRYPSWPMALSWIAAGIATLALFASVLAHELAHASAAQRLGVPVRGIALFLFGGIAQFRKEAPTPWIEILIALSGPGASMAIGGVFLGASLLVGDLPEPLAELCLWVGALNLALAVFNLLPWLPLDGGRLLRALAWFASDDRRWANRVALLAGQLGAVALFFGGIVMLLTHQGGLANAIWLMLVGWFVYTSAVASYQTSTLTLVLDDAPVVNLMSRRLGRLERNVAGLPASVGSVGPWGPEYYVVAHEGRDVGVVAVSGLQAEQPAKSDLPGRGAEQALLDVIVPIQPDMALDETASAMDALRLFIERDVQWAPVVREGEVIGVIRRIDVAEYVERHRQ